MAAQVEPMHVEREAPCTQVERSDLTLDGDPVSFRGRGGSRGARATNRLVEGATPARPFFVR
jgi:hypothetical protein